MGGVFMKTNLRIDTGLVEFNMKILEKKVPFVARRTLKDAGDKILERSQELVPVDTGTLKSVGRVVIGIDSSFFSANSTKVAVTYTDIYAINPESGKSTAQYAAPVHEDEYASHPVGQAKYLSRAVDEWANGDGFGNLSRKVLEGLGL